METEMETIQEYLKDIALSENAHKHLEVIKILCYLLLEIDNYVSGSKYTREFDFHKLKVKFDFDGMR